MRLFINTTILQATGIVQVAVSFINECKKIQGNEYIVLINGRMQQQLDLMSFPDNFLFYKIDIRPLHFIRNYYAIKKLKRLEDEYKPDCVFTVFGPSWWTPKVPHLMGYAHAQYIYEDSPYYDMVSYREILMKNIKKIIHGKALKKNGKYYVCETEDVRQRLTKFLSVSESCLFSVPNTCSDFFNDFVSNELILPPKSDNEFRFISLCAYYKHKNLKILNQIIPLLTKRLPDVKLRFVLTIGEKALYKNFSSEVIPYIICLDRVDVRDCPQLYYECDALFLPTLLECFTANYPEAMKMRKPIITSNLSFATTICQDAALYCDALDPDSIVDEMEKLVCSKELQQSLIELGVKRLEEFKSSGERAEAYLSICKEICKH